MGDRFCLRVPDEISMGCPEKMTRMQRPQIKTAEAADIDQCHRIETACFLPSEAASHETMMRRQRVYPEGFLVAELDGRVVGILNSGATDKADLADEELKSMIGHDPEGRYLVIFSLAVDPDFRRRGISRALLDVFAENARAASKGAILLLCKEHLVGFYQKMGYSNRGPSASSHGGFAWFEMKLDLGP